MMCPNCSIHLDTWVEMRAHYKFIHPEEKRPDKLFTKEARLK